MRMKQRKHHTKEVAMPPSLSIGYSLTLVVRFFGVNGMVSESPFTRFFLTSFFPLSSSVHELLRSLAVEVACEGLSTV